MDNQTITQVQFLQRQAASLLLYQSVLDSEVGMAFGELLEVIRYGDDRGCLQAYGKYFYCLATRQQNWEDFLINQILYADNPFSRQVQVYKFTELSPALINAVRHDLQALQSLYECSCAILSHWVQSVVHLPVSPVLWYQETPPAHKSAEVKALMEKFHTQEDWGELVEDLAKYYQKWGIGIFSQYGAFRWENNQLVGIAHPDPITLGDLAGYEQQQATLVKNTQALLAGFPALHVLLYGSRGSGKSSLVKALLNEYADSGLRMIEVRKQKLVALPEIIEKIRNLSLKFIIFVDDLSFEDDDDAFKTLKVVLEGNLTARASNVVVYATSNRRHLVREYFSERPQPREADEIHAWDSKEEKLSFSDRFGLTLTFAPADQTTYLKIVGHLATKANITIEPEALKFQALQWATHHNGLSGRSARQFIDFLQAEVATTAKKSHRRQKGG